MDYELLNQYINNMINYSNDIRVKYKELLTLELSGLKNTNLYRTVCVNLKNGILEESSYYNSFDFDEEDIEYIIDFLCEHYDIDINQSLESLLHNNVQLFSHVMRVVFKLQDLIKNNFQTEELEIDEKELNNHFIFQKNLLLNYCRVLESHISDYNKDSRNLKSVLYIKYFLPFINTNIEKEFCNNFDFNEEIYLDYKMYGDYFRMSDVVQKQYIHLHLFNKFVDEVNDLLEIKDKDYDNSYDKIIISEIIIKSILVFFDDDFISDILDDLAEYITSNWVYYSESGRIVANLLNLDEITKKDKSKYRYLSLRLPKN